MSRGDTADGRSLILLRGQFQLIGKGSHFSQHFKRAIPFILKLLRGTMSGQVLPRNVNPLPLLRFIRPGEIAHRQSPATPHIPCLENIYQSRSVEFSPLSMPLEEADVVHGALVPRIVEYQYIMQQLGFDSPRSQRIGNLSFFPLGQIFSALLLISRLTHIFFIILH